MTSPADTQSTQWALVEELLERGDPDFVAELRRVTDAERLGAFAARWYADPRPSARRRRRRTSWRASATRFARRSTPSSG